MKIVRFSIIVNVGHSFYSAFRYSQIVMLTVLSLGASQDVEVNAPQELAQQDPSINQQAPAKGADYLVSDEEYTASRGVASASVASSPPQQIQPVQGYGNAPVISASYGIAAPVQSYGSAVVPPVPNSRPLPVPESGGYASAAIVAPAPAVPVSN